MTLCPMPYAGRGVGVGLIWDGLREAVELLSRGDRALYSTAARSLYVSGVATLVSLALGVLAGAFLAFQRFRGRGLALAFVNTGLGLAPGRGGPVGPVMVL